MEDIFFFFSSISKPRQKVVHSSQMPRLFLFAGVFKLCVCAAELGQAVCVGILSVWSWVFAGACQCLCFTVQLLKAAWI